MIDKDELRDFSGFLRTANDGELADRRQIYEKSADLLPRGSELRADYLFLLRRLREEQVARLEVAEAIRRRVQSVR